MARMTLNAGDEYALKLSRLLTGSDEIAKKAIYEGAKIVADEIKSRIPVDTGDLADSFGTSSIDKDGNGDWNTKLGFDGYDRDGMANQYKARILESGTSKQSKRPFVRPALNATRRRAKAEMERIVDEEIEKLMGGK